MGEVQAATGMLVQNEVARKAGVDTGLGERATTGVSATGEAVPMRFIQYKVI